MLGILIEYRIVDMQGQNAIWRQGRKNLILRFIQGQAPNDFSKFLAVELADPPLMTISTEWTERDIIYRRSMLYSGPQPKPVVVMILDTWKKEITKALRNISIEMKAIVGNQYAR